MLDQTLEPGALRTPVLDEAPEIQVPLPSSADTTPGRVAGDVALPQAPQIPPRPSPDTNVIAFVEGLWKETSELPAFDEAVQAARQAQETLFPAWHDRGDKWRGKVPGDKRTRKEDRLVRTPHIYLNQRQAIAQTVPEDHDAQWKPRERVKPRDSDEIAASDTEERFAATVRIVVREYLSEARIQEWLEAFVQDAKSYPIAILKMTFQRDWQSDALNGTETSGDQQDNVARIKLLTDEVARGNITKDDPRYVELNDLVKGLGQTSELNVWRRLRVATVPINCFRAPDSCRDPLTIYEQPWLCDDTELTAETIRTKYPFQMKDDGTWEGVHPEDLELATGAIDAHGNRVSQDLRRRSSRRGGGSRRGAALVKSTLIVREVWHRLSGWVYLLCEGVPYPIAKWRPERQHAGWFPYLVVVPNRISNDLYGISDVELQADIQHRINRKATDEEKARWLGLPRDFFDSSTTDEAKIATAIKEAKPGTATGLPMQGRPITEFLQRLTWEHKPESFSRAEDFQHLRQAARIPEQSMGLTGRADFAEELKLAREGQALATSYDQGLYKRVLVDLYDRAAQMLIFELEPDDWYEVAGPHALVPELGTEAEVRAARKQAATESAMAAQEQVKQALAGGDTSLLTPWGMPDEVVMKRKAREIAKAMEGQLLENRYGPEGLISREGLYRRLRCEVVLSLNGSIDRDRRMVAINRMMEALKFAAEAAAASGMRFNPKPFLRRLSQLAGENESLDAMFDDDPNALAGTLVRLLGKGEQLDDDTIAILGKVLGPIMAAQSVRAEQEGGAVPSAPPEAAAGEQEAA